MSEPKPKNKILNTLRRKKWLIIGMVVVAIIIVGTITISGDGDTEDSQTPTAEVTRGPMLIAVTEGGDLESERRKIISNELRWPVIIREVVDEGTVVEVGQTIIEFECKELLDEISQEELQVTTAKNSYNQASQNLELKRKEMNNNVAKAKRTLEETTEDRDRYLEHEYRILKFETDSAVSSAEEDLAIAKNSLESKIDINKKMKDDSPYSEAEIRADKLKVQRLENAFEKSKLEKQKLDRYDHKRKLRDLEAAISDAKLSLERAELEAKGQILIAEADTQAKKRTFEMRSKKLEELREDEKKLIVKAEKEGLVVYDTGRRRNTEIVIAKGEKINPRQQLLMIPDMSTIQITTKVYEAVISKVKPGLEAFIRLDVDPNNPIKGTVKKVAVLPSTQNRWLNPDLKTFDVVVTFDEKPEDLKPGMTCQVELVIDRLGDALQVPIAAIFTEQDKTVCYRAGSDEPVEVKIGGMNDTNAQILSGLDEGDEVLLVKPGSQTSEDGDKNGNGQPVGGGPGA